MEKGTPGFSAGKEVIAGSGGLFPEELFVRLGLLIRLRWAGSAFLAALVSYLAAVFREADFQLMLLAALFCVTLLFNLALHVDLKRQRVRPDVKQLLKAVNLQFYFDVVFYLAFVWLTGGVHSPFFILMIFPAVSSALVFPPPLNYYRLVLVLGLFGSLLFAQVAMQMFPPLMVTGSLGGRAVFSFAGLAGAACLLAYLFIMLIQNLRGKIRNLTEMHDTMKSNYFETVMALARAVEAKHPEMKHHIENSVLYAELIGRRFSLPEEEMECLKFGVVLHDIGKIAVDESILLKPSGLTREEYEKMKKHPEHGIRIVAGLNFLKGIEPIILSHHERYDGKGYPEGLKGSQINLLARIVSLIDAFEAMTAERCYAPSKTMGEARAEIIRERGGQFDPEVVDVFLSVLDSA